jgi:choline dehydrogenase-like flavoprotein
MGNDALAVVDTQLRVARVEGLRIADVSIFPSIIGGITSRANAPLIATDIRRSSLYV